MSDNTVIQLKKSGQTGNTPLLVDLQYGELAINYSDGKLFYKTDLDQLGSIYVPDHYGTINVNNNLLIPLSPSEILSIKTEGNVTATGDSGNDTIIISETISPIAFAAFDTANAAFEKANTSSTVYPNTGIAVSTGTSWGPSKNTPTGEIVGTTDTQTLTNKTVSGGIYSNVVDVTGSVRSSVVAVAALDIDCSLGNYFTKTINGNSTFTFSNAPASKAYSFVLELTHTSGTVTWPASVRWPASTAPTLTAGKTHIFVFVTDDGGNTWRGASSVDYTN